MKKPDLDKLTDGMAQGSGAEAFETTDGRTYNVVGAANALSRLHDQIVNYGLTYPDDFPATREDDNPDSASVTDDVDLISEAEVDEAQQAMQYMEDALGSLMSSFTGNDGGIEDANGNSVVDLPNAATSAGKTGDLPDTANN